jgi:hypothetical protein
MAQIASSHAVEDARDYATPYGRRYLAEKLKLTVRVPRDLFEGAKPCADDMTRRSSPVFEEAV